MEDYEDILIEARAKIIWGQPPESVRKFLLEEGVPAADVDTMFAPIMEQRRQDSLNGMGLGLLLALGGFGGAIGPLFFASRISLSGMAVLICLGFYGCYKMIDQFANWHLARRQLSEMDKRAVSWRDY